MPSNAGSSQAAGRREAGSPTDLPPGTLVDLFRAPIERHPEGTALLVRRGEADWEKVSFGEAAELVRDLALGLKALGLERGDRVGIISATRYEWALADFAMIMAGLVSVPVYDSQPAEQIAYILGDAGARTAFVSDDEQMAKLVEAAAEVELERAIAFEPVSAAGAPFDVASWEELLENGRQASHLRDGYENGAASARPDELATLIYTSGTTGAPKGVMLSHDNLYSNSVLAAPRLRICPQDLVLSWLPLSHVFERTAGHFCTWHCGAPVAYAESVETVARDMLEVRPTFMTGVPRFYEKVYEAATAAAAAGGAAKVRIFEWARGVGERRVERVLAGEKPGLALELQHRVADRLVFSKLRARTGGRIRYLISGAAALSPEIARFFWAAGLRVVEGYGLTEASPVISVNPIDAVRLGTVGTPIEGVEVRIAEDGEILCRSRGVMQGYYRNEQATREAIDPERWLHTGDIGQLDDDGYLSITDRKKELIVTSYGKNVTPQPIEETMKRSPLIDQVALVGNGRKFLLALVVPNFDRLGEWAASQGLSFSGPSELATQPAAIEHVEAEIARTLRDFADFEQPKSVLLLDEEFSIEAGTLTPTQKVRRRVVAQRLGDRIERAYREAARP